MLGTVLSAEGSTANITFGEEQAVSQTIKPHIPKELTVMSCLRECSAALKFYKTSQTGTSPTS